MAVTITNGIWSISPCGSSLSYSRLFGYVVIRLVKQIVSLSSKLSIRYFVSEFVSRFHIQLITQLIDQPTNDLNNSIYNKLQYIAFWETCLSQWIQLPSAGRIKLTAVNTANNAFLLLILGNNIYCAIYTRCEATVARLVTVH
jgi:hypothetical protein